MSRIGRMPIALPAGVKIDISEHNLVTVTGPKGTLSESISPKITVTVAENVVHVTRSSDEKLDRSLHGLSRTLIENMVVGVTKGYSKTLEIVGVGYKAQKQGTKLTLNLGHSHPIYFNDGDGITFEVPSQEKIIIKGINKQAVGQIAATIRGKRPPEPYHGKGVKYSDEVIRRKDVRSTK